MGSNRQAGMALVLVLWFVSLLSILALGFSRSVRTEIQIAHNLLEDIRDRHLAEAAVQMGIHELLKSDQDDLPSLVSGVSKGFLFDGRQLSYAIQDERGKVDLNQAPDELLLNLLQTSGVEDTQAAGILDAIADWRDDNDLRRLNGAELAEYEEAGLKAVPSNKPFVSIDELQQVIGIDTELYNRLKPNITVHGFNEQINPQSAPRNVLEALPEVSTAEIDEIIAARESDTDEDTGRVFPGITGVDNWISLETGPAFSVKGIATSSARAAYARELTIWITDGTYEKPYFVLDSRIGAREPELEQE
jgi:general secretion pathway protein K